MKKVKIAQAVAQDMQEQFEALEQGTPEPVTEEQLELPIEMYDPPEPGELPAETPKHAPQGFYRGFSTVHAAYGFLSTLAEPEKYSVMALQDRWPLPGPILGYFVQRNDA